MCPHNPVDQDEAARLGPRNWLGPVCEPCFSEFIKSQSRALAEAEKELAVWRNEDAREAKYEWVSKQATAAEERAAQAERALRSFRESHKLPLNLSPTI